MSSKVRSLEQAMAERKLRQQQKPAGGQEPAVEQFAVDGEKPPRLPLPGQSVLLCWADPNLVGGPQMELGFLVSTVNKKSVDGRVNGWTVMDPTMQAPGPGGRPMQMPALIPVLNVAYSPVSKPMTWRFHEDVMFDAAEPPPAAVGG